MEKNDKKRGCKFISGFFFSLARSLAFLGGLGGGGGGATFQGSRYTLRVFFFSLAKKGKHKRKARATKRGETFESSRVPLCLPLSFSPNLFPLSLSLPLLCPSPSTSSHLSHRVLARPLAGGLLVPRPVRLVDVGDLRDERVVRVGVAEQRADREEDLGEGERGRPLLLEDVEADGALGVDVGVVDLFCFLGGCFQLFWSEREREREKAAVVSQKGKERSEDERRRRKERRRKRKKGKTKKKLTLVWNWTLGGLNG